MKRSFYALGLMLAATFTLTNCAKEMDAPVQEPSSTGIPFEIIANAVDTKTTNNGLSTVWAEGDALNVFHAEAGAATYVDNGQFTYGATENGNFAGTLAAELTAEAYDWYAFYPYSKFIKTPANTSSGYMPVGSKSNAVQTQTGNDSMAHIAGENYPMWGIAENVAVGETPTITMTHLTSLIAVEVINEIPTGDDLTVESVSFTAPEGVDIVGTYYIDFSTSTPGFTGSGDNYVSSTAKLSVVDGTPIAVDESAKFYIAVKPFTAEAGATLELNVNGYSKTLTLQNDAVFAPGKFKNVSFAYDQAPVEVDENTDVLNRELTGIEDTQTSYETWSGKTSNTSAVYAGQSAGNNNSIQLRSANNNSGIITTTSGGYAKSIVVTWNANTASGRTLAVYGSNKAYSSPEELYNVSTQGTPLGTIVCGTSTELIIEGNYEYIGLRSESGAMYISEILVKWSDEAVEVAALESISVSGQTTEYVLGENFVFDGLVTAAYADASTKQVVPTSVSTPDMTTAGDKTVTVTYTEGEVTVTYEYTITVTAPTESWTKVNSLAEIVTGEYVIVVKTSSKAGFLPSTTTTSAPAFTDTGLTISGDQIAKVEDNMKFNFAVTEVDGKPQAVITNSAGNYLYITNTNNGVRIGTTSITWAIDNHDAEGTFKFTTTTISRFLGVYNNQDWRCYTTYNAGNFTNASGSSAIYLYKKN